MKMSLDHLVLRFPGPTPLPPSVERAMTLPMVARGPEMTEAIVSLSPKLKPIFGTKQEVAVMSGSGTASMETAIVNVTNSGDEVLVLVTGRFGELYASMCEAHLLHVHVLETKWGEAADPEAVKDYLKSHPNIKAVFATFCETSTGVINPMKDLAAVVHEYSDAVFIADGVSSVGGIAGNMDEWGIDILGTGSQKAMMAPPGLGFVAFSERAQEVAKQVTRGRFFFDYNKYIEQLAEGQSPFTPAVPLLNSLNASLDLMHEEGIDNVFARHRLLSDMTRAAFKQWNIPLTASDETASPTITGAKADDFDVEELLAVVKKDFHIAIAGGLGKMAGKMLRIGHMGYCSPADALQYISALEIGLVRIGKKINLGEGIQAAQEVFLSTKKV